MSQNDLLYNKENNNLNSQGSFKLPDIPQSYFQSLLEFEDKYADEQKNQKKEKEEKENDNVDNIIKPDEAFYPLEQGTQEKQNNENIDYYNEEFFGLDNKEEKNDIKNSNNIKEINKEKNGVKNIDGNNPEQKEGYLDVNDFFFSEDNEETG